MEESFDELKKRAADYYASNQVPQRLEEILNKMFFEDPEDINGRLAEYFESFSLPPVIRSLKSKEIISSSGPALQCYVCAFFKNHQQVVASSKVSVFNEMNYVHQQVYPESVESLSIEEILDKNCKNIEESISERLNGVPLHNQREVDSVLSDWLNSVEHVSVTQDVIGEPDDACNSAPTPSSGKKKKTPSAKKGGKGSDKPVPPREPPEHRHPGFTSIVASSLAVLKSSSSLTNLPPFVRLNLAMAEGECPDVRTFTMPAVAMTVLTGGKTAPGKFNLFKHVFAIAAPGTGVREGAKTLASIYHHIGKAASAKGGAPPPTGAYGAFQPSYEKLEQPLDAVQEAINALGLTAGQDVYIGVDCAAHEIFDYDKGKYEVLTGGLKTADDMVEAYRDAVSRYPSLIMIINPLRKEDREQWPKLCEAVSEKCFVIGGEDIYGSLHKLDVSTLTARPSSGVAISNGGRVTCTDLHRIVNDVRATSGVTILTSPPDDVCDDVYSDVAVGLGVDVILLGAPTRGEQTSRLNRLGEIEEIIGEDEKLSASYREGFSFPVIKPPPPPEVLDVPEATTPEVSTTPSDQKSKKK